MPPIEPPSLWNATWTRPQVAPVDLPHEADVVIVGGGYTGLWTAFSLVTNDPATRVVVIERHQVGFGASGRNGGWCSALFPLGLDDLARQHGRDAAVALQRAMFDAVESVGRFAANVDTASGGGDGLFHPGGTLTLARSDRQLASIRREASSARRFGIGEDDIRLLDAAEANAMCAATGVRGGIFSPHCAAVHPLRLVSAMAAACRDHGVTIVEGTDVTDITPATATTPARVHTSRGDVTAEVVVLATEAFTTQLPGHRRDCLPLYSMMIGSEPIPDERWAEIGLDDRPTFADARHAVIYGQRTADGRLAFGGRGAPYHFGSTIDPVHDTDEEVRRRLVATVADLFPSLADVQFPFHWGGPLAVPRDWHPHVRFDRATGIASAGGYVGDGVATANLAGRALADLILGRDTELTRLPIVGHRLRRWEPEPLRWAGIRLVALAARRADDADAAGRPRAAAVWDRVYTTFRG
jgi:glycine/D-amino acid oxidase-like deaminating enzyme